MRRVAALAITIGLAWILISRFGEPVGPSVTLGLGIALLSAVIAGWLCEFVRLPRITGYLALGLVSGPSLANLITASTARDLQAVSAFTLVLISVIAGLHLDFRAHRETWRGVFSLSILTMLATWAAMVLGFVLIWTWFPIFPDLGPAERATAAVLTALLVTTPAPAVTIAVIAEAGSRGPLTTLAAQVTVLMQLLGALLFAAYQVVLPAMFGAPSAHMTDVLIAGIWSVGGAAAFGLIAGAIFMLYLMYVGRELTVVFLALCLGLTGVVAPFGFEPFLAGLAAGILIQNVRPAAGEIMRDAAEHGAMPALVLFFAVRGASMHVEAVAAVGLSAAAVVAFRLLAMRAATRVSARLAGVDAPEVPLLWRALVPTAGTSLGLMALASTELPGWSANLQALIVAVVAINQLIGPIIFRATLVQAREIGPERGQLVVVSNREPWMHERAEDGSIVVRPTPGGVSVALDALMRERGGVWIAHGAGSADRLVVDKHDRVRVPPDAPAYTLKRVWFTSYQEEHYYAGFANSALWPLCHQAHVRPVFREEDWKAYEQVNRLFAEAAIEEAPPGASVFLNDYHLALAALTLRRRSPSLRTALFWHIPWPDVDRLRICPWRRELLEGLLANDLVAFQLPRDQRHFLSAVNEDLRATISGDAVYHRSRVVRVVAIPIGADFERISALQADDESLAARMAALSQELCLAGRTVGVGVDRLDYTKGIPERIAAIERVLRERPDVREQFVFVQVGVPSRSDVHGYAEISAEIDELVARVNRELGAAGRPGPILYIKRAFQLPDLVALYRLADFCIVSSLHDGMNLVAKEFVAAREDLGGVLILSELAGASEELAESLLINPYDDRGFAEAIARAIDMPEWERRRRMQALRRRVSGRNVLAWASDILDRLERQRRGEFLAG
ncbi:MAG: trehalose-6-phosphate synthase [Acidobacteria bacterium]|nr:trehalose-6-phosphate synthase [Acidobacteriota bacterium]